MTNARAAASASPSTSSCAAPPECPASPRYRDLTRRKVTLRYPARCYAGGGGRKRRSEEHTSELQSLMRISYAVFCLKKKKKKETKRTQKIVNTRITRKHNKETQRKQNTGM